MSTLNNHDVTTSTLNSHSDELENVRAILIEKFSEKLSAEISLAQHGDAFFDRKFWSNYLCSKYSYQETSNRFYVLIHELSK